MYILTEILTQHSLTYDYTANLLLLDFHYCPQPYMGNNFTLGECYEERGQFVRGLEPGTYKAGH